MISGTVVYDVTAHAAQLFAPPGVKVSIYNADPDYTVWLSTRDNVAAGLGIPLPPNGLIAWDADKSCYAVCSPGQQALVAATDNSGALNFQGPSLAQITAVIPTPAEIAAAIPPVTVNLPLTATQALYGDGSDGAVTIGSDTTAIRDLHYTTLHVTSSGRVRTNGFRLQASTSITIDGGGLVTNDGIAAVFPTGGSSPGGAGAPGGTLAGGGNGGAGKGVGGAGPGTVGAAVNPGLGGGGGQGGGSYYTPTAVGAVGGLSTNGPPVPAFPLGQLAAATALGGGGGGGGGGGDATVAADYSGGGGGGGGVIVVASPTIANSGTIRADGGKGGDSNAGSGSGGGQGGGGGGGGGIVYIIAATYSGGVTTANGGQGGAGTSPDPTVNRGNPGRNGYVLRITP